MDESGAHPDPERKETIQEMKAPANVSEVRRFLGMVNQLSKFCPNLAEKTKPIVYQECMAMGSNPGRSLSIP